MNRRSFLKAVAGFVAAPNILAWLPQHPELKFNPAAQYGDYVLYTDGAVDEAWLAVVRSARRFLPIGTQFALILKETIPTAYDPLAQVGSIAWKYSPGEPSPDDVLMTA